MPREGDYSSVEGEARGVALLHEALVRRDAKFAPCPFNGPRPPNNAERCGLCDADSSEPCRRRVSADADFVDDARAALARATGDGR